jgi:hypothetical protein
MKRFLMIATIAAVGLTLLAAAQTRAAGPSGQGSGYPTRGFSGHHGMYGHRFKASERFDYRRYGFRSLSWRHYRWSSYYHGYCYWAPRYGWCFYEPTYSCYLPVSYFSEVYPEAATAVAPVVSPAPSVVQQTTVVATPPAPVADLPAPPPTPAVVPAPAPVAVQKTKVGPGVP